MSAPYLCGPACDRCEGRSGQVVGDPDGYHCTLAVRYDPRTGRHLCQWCWIKARPGPPPKRRAS